MKSSLNSSEGSDQIGELSRFSRKCNASQQYAEDRPIVSAPGTANHLSKLDAVLKPNGLGFMAGMWLSGGLRSTDDRPAKSRAPPPQTSRAPPHQKWPKVVEGPIKVLVVDDDNGQRMVMRAMLSKMGYFEVVTAEDGEQALAKIRETWTAASPRTPGAAGNSAADAADASPSPPRKLFDLVLMDGFMPNMTGYPRE
ncbi:hypothetical protein T484DRAFT_1857134 [Baffinella frigidus]|nr:hypothetical protein T484DRAFT_1857134 [Cryptophyta sp. CCMP2293]